MKLEELLTRISEGIESSFDAVEEKGGTVPQEKVSSNLAESISTIPVVEVPEYGQIGLYRWSEGIEKTTEDNCTVTNMDSAKFAAFIEQYPAMSMGETRYMFNYQENWQAGDGSYAWNYYWEQGELWIAPEDMASTTGITVTVTDPSMGYAMLECQNVLTVDTSAVYQTVTLQSQLELESLIIDNAGEDATRWTVNGVTFPPAAVASIVTGAKITSFPEQWLNQCRNMVSVDISNSTLVTSLPQGFLSSSESLSTFGWNPNITTVGDNFLYGCSKFNQSLNFSKLTSIGGWFLGGCTSYNQPTSLPGITIVGGYFMAANSSFNSTLSFPNVTVIKNNFLNSCRLYNQPLPTTPNLVGIGASFLKDCAYFNQPITYDFTKIGGTGTGITPTIGVLAGFLDGCSSFNKPLDLTGVTQFSGLQGASSFNSPLNLSTLQSISGGLGRMTSFNQPINAPELTQYVGVASVGFLQGCTSFNQPFYAPKLTYVSYNFMDGCSSFNSQITLGDLTHVDYAFMQGCTAFNQPLPFLSKLKTLYTGFLTGCKSLNQDLDLSSVDRFYGSGTIMYNCDAMTKTVKLGAITRYDSFSTNAFSTITRSASSYQTGFTIEVPDSATQTSFKNQFPNRTSSPYRKLNVVVTA